jgi:hypothetical protein
MSEVHRLPMGFAVLASVPSSSDWHTKESVPAAALRELVVGLRHLKLWQ